MSLPASFLIDAIRQARLLPPEQLAQACALVRTRHAAAALAEELVRLKWLTKYQAEELLAGRGSALVLGQYVLLERLGKGGMGEVFRALHKDLDREVAVKRILAERLDAPDAVARFGREAKAAARLSHANVVRVYDAGEANGCHYIAMELLAGEDLAKHLARRGPLPIAEAVEYVRQACAGMQHVHDKGLVHRDLKPSNLMLCADGTVKVMDLGLARADNDTALTQTGVGFGTADYIAPEQVQNTKGVDIRADVYSLGCTLYQLLCGRTPFHDAFPAARYMMHVSEKPDDVVKHRAEVPEQLAAVVRKMMAKSPAERFATPGEAAAALGRLSSQRPPPPPLPPLPPPEPNKDESEWPTTRKLPPPVPPTLTDVPSSGPISLPRKQAKGDPPWLGVVIAVALAMALGCLGLFVVSPLLEPKERVAEPADKDKPKVGEAKLGDTFTNDLGMRFVRIKAGKFMMGSPAGEEGREEDEQQHEAEITKDFWMSVHEVTQGQYRAVMGYNPSNFSHDGTKSDKGKYDFSQPRGGSEQVKAFTQKQLDEHPVECVSWQDAQDFLIAMNARAKLEKIRVEYRLPSEAEWEYSSRNSGTYQVFSFGDSLSSKQANFDGNFPYGGADKGDYLQRTTKVGSFAPGPHGLCDMHGNVWEWCADWFGPYAKGRVSDPKGPPDGSIRVFRGGGWDDLGRRCRAAYRLRSAPSDRNRYLGIRVVAVPQG